jgi:murein DD-endopeptidase MepM/ murein hydrolase activator NlpD
MAVDRGKGESFDPRSWLRIPGATAPHGPSAAGDPQPGKDPESFDPSTWIGKAPPPRAQPAPVAVENPTPSGSPILAGGAVVLLALAGVSAALLSRPPANHLTSRPVIVAQAPNLEEAPQPTEPVEQPGHSRRTVTLAGPEDVSGAIGDLGIDAPQVALVTKQVLDYIGQSPGELRLTADLAQSNGRQSLRSLEITRVDGAGVRLLADGARFKPQKLLALLTTKTIAVRGEMGTTFYDSAVEAGVDDSLISDFAGAFNYDVDFQFELQPGDIFEGAFEQDYNPSGEPVGPPRLLFASLRLQDKSLRFYRFKSGSGYGWFDSYGRSNHRSLMRTPVDGARVSSGFGMRYHPVLHFTRMHQGTDFAAPIGTPVYAAANGKVMVAACCHGDAGTMVALQHDNGWVTHYFHLSKIMPGIVPGVRVTQGERIAEVGMSGGHVTGPHLHYEVLISGVHVDPLKVPTGEGVTLAQAEMVAFKRERDRIDSARAAAGDL